MEEDEKDVEFVSETDADMRRGDAHGAEHKVEKLKNEIEKIKKEKQEYLDGWHRSKADYVNALKRFEEEKKLERARGVEKAVEQLLPAFDALERAKAHGEVPQGFAAIAKQLEGAFSGLGLEQVGQVGEKFDPTLHEAYGQDPVDSQEDDDKVTAILEQGYRIGDKIIRPAKVKVAHFG